MTCPQCSVCVCGGGVALLAVRLATVGLAVHAPLMGTEVMYVHVSLGHKFAQAPRRFCSPQPMCGVGEGGERS